MTSDEREALLEHKRRMHAIRSAARTLRGVCVKCQAKLEPDWDKSHCEACLRKYREAYYRRRKPGKRPLYRCAICDGEGHRADTCHRR